jgi:hypothetical protein
LGKHSARCQEAGRYLFCAEPLQGNADGGSAKLYVLLKAL